MTILILLSICCLVLSPLAGYAVGNTLVNEDIFEDLRGRVERGPHRKVVDIDGVGHIPVPHDGIDGEGIADRTGHSWFYAPPEASEIYLATCPTEGIEGMVTEVLCMPTVGVYRPGFTGRLRGFIGDLLTECCRCTSAQATLWFSIYAMIFILVGLETAAFATLIPFAAVGISYILDKYIHRSEAKTILLP